MFARIGKMLGMAGGKTASKVAGKASSKVTGKAAEKAAKGGLWSTTKKAMGSSFGQAVLWSAVPTLAMGLFTGFSSDA